MLNLMAVTKRTRMTKAGIFPDRETAVGVSRVRICAMVYGF